MNKPHGGMLIERICKGEQKESIKKLEKIGAILKIRNNHIQEAQNIAQGVFSPLEGFLEERDFLAVLDNMRLSSGVIWPIPIVLDVTTAQKNDLEGSDTILLADEAGNHVAFLHNPTFFEYDKRKFAKKVFGTLDQKHPGVHDVFGMNDYLVGGKIELLRKKIPLFSKHQKTPRQARREFKKKGWQNIVAFQTRNVPHRGHEFLQKEALKKADGLFIQPVIGQKKIDDFKDEYIIGSYEILIERYLPSGKAMLGVLPLKMRYGGPREAVLHALIRKNFGCTHFILGRDHAGVGNFYAPDAAQKIFDGFPRDEIGIEILKFPEVVYDNLRKRHCFIDECPRSNKIRFSGTKIREYVKNKTNTPEYLLRSEVYELLASSDNSLVDNNYTMKKNKKGFVLWFTGLSGAGKSTIADLVYDHLKVNGTKIERLDGDVVRENLTQDLGFTKKDRDENVRRVGFVADLLSRNGVGVIASFISPYQQQRDELREKVENFIEVFVNAPLDVCERRDTKGLYKKARTGEIKNFTGISDPYDEPKNPDVELKTDIQTPEECLQQVLDYLEREGYLE